MADHLVARRRVAIVDPLGLHMRPASRFTALAESSHSDVAVACNGFRADGRSILDLVGLDAHCGAILEIEAHGPDAERIVAALADLIVARLDEAGARGG